MIFQITIFVASVLVLFWLSSRFIETLVQVAKYLRWREFVFAFFVMGLASSLPIFFVDLPAALQGMPSLSFGDIVGGNLVDLTLAMALVVFFSKKGFSTNSRTVQGSSLFTVMIALLPIF